MSSVCFGASSLFLQPIDLYDWPFASTSHRMSWFIQHFSLISLVGISSLEATKLCPIVVFAFMASLGKENQVEFAHVGVGLCIFF